MQIVSKIANPQGYASNVGGERTVNVDVRDLEEELRKTIEGEVRFDDGSRGLYATDASNYRQIPIGVVIPRSEQDIIKTLAACRAHGAPVLARGGGTSLAGQCCNVAVVIDASKYLRRIIDLNAAGKQARVEPGIVLDDLRNAGEQHHLTFGPDPATHTHCTLGGMIGNNSCGVHALMAGKTAENVDELKVLTYDGLQLHVGKTSEAELQSIVAQGGRRGEIYAGLKNLRDRYADLIRKNYPKIPRRVSGYNLDELLPENGFHVARALVGTESTCVFVLEALLRLVFSPPGRSLLVLGYPDVFAAADAVPEILERHHPIGLEGIDDGLIEDMKKKQLHPEDLPLLPEGKGWLIIEFGGKNKEESDQQARALMAELKEKPRAPSSKLYDNPAEEKLVWQIRESGLGATANVPGSGLTWPGWEDAAVAPEKVGDYLREFKKLLDKYKYRGDLYGHFGQGCVHTRINFGLKTAEGIKTYREFIHEAADLVVSYGGSLSGEHGDGQSRAELLPRMYGPELIQAFREFKRIWDPEWKMNPGKIVDAYRMDDNLRLGSRYEPWVPKTHFTFPDDHGSFAAAGLRCVGVGECRREREGVMCPSYMVTHEEMHSTRGRSRLLFEMMQGDVVTGGWKNKTVREALDLCLGCKGCKGECPVNVDMATYKAEFLSHYYEGRPLPMHAYAIGLIYRWARLASMAPSIVNFFMRAPGLRSIAKGFAGIAQKRTMPKFARQTFKHAFLKGKSDRQQPLTERTVVLWPDTFTNHFHPQIALAAVEVLEDAGFAVKVPRESLCCGRPLYDYGMLDRAKSQLQNIFAALKEELAAGTPIVGLEPSCVSVFRDEATSLFPNDENAQRLRKQMFLLSEFLEQRAPHYQPPELARKAIVHPHCHHKAILKIDAEKSILSKLKLDFHMLDAGCCGMAGGFGFEKEHYDVSMAVGERVLLPEVRNTPEDTLIIADGFSCREQILQATGREALHLAQVIQMAIHRRSQPVPGEGAGPEARPMARAVKAGG